MKKIDSCRLCGGEVEAEFCLKPMALVDDYKSGLAAEKYPTELFVCKNCSLAQLGVVVEPEILFNRNYSYKTGKSLGLVAHFEELATELVFSLSLNPNSFVVDIGCNDGTFLKMLRDKSRCRVLGIDPAAPRELPAIQEVLSQRTFNMAFSQYGLADLVIATNVLGHVDDIGSFLKIINKFLKPDGTFVCEVGSLNAIVEDCVWETIYHEHLSYFSIETLGYALFTAGFVSHIMPIETHGGSLRAVATKLNDHIPYVPTSGNNYNMFAAAKENVELRKTKILELFKDGAAFGASAKGSVILQQTGIRPQFVVDDTPAKQGGFMPGSDIMVCSRKALENFDGNILVLAWNEVEAIKESLPKKFAGKLVVAAPTPYVV